MSALSITTANVLMSASGRSKAGTAGAAITGANQPLYYDTATKTYKLARANALGTVHAEGVSLHPAAAGQPIRLCTFDPDLTPGVSTAEGVKLAVSSAAAGAIVPDSDLTTGDFPFIFGIVKDGGHWAIDFENALKTDSALP